MLRPSSCTHTLFLIHTLTFPVQAHITVFFLKSLLKWKTHSKDCRSDSKVTKQRLLKKTSIYFFKSKPGPLLDYTNICLFEIFCVIHIHHAVGSQGYMKRSAQYVCVPLPSWSVWLGQCKAPGESTGWSMKQRKRWRRMEVRRRFQLFSELNIDPKP